MEEIQIAYSRKYLRINLIQGLVWFAFFLANLLLSEEKQWISYGWLCLSLLYFLTYGYCASQKYLTLTPNSISVNRPLGKTVDLNDIARIKYFAGDIILKTTKGKDLPINSQIIAPDSLELLNRKLQELQDNRLLATTK